MDHFASLFMVSPLLLGVLFFVAMLAGFIDSGRRWWSTHHPGIDGGRDATCASAGDQ